MTPSPTGSNTHARIRKALLSAKYESGHRSGIHKVIASLDLIEDFPMRFIALAGPMLKFRMAEWALCLYPELEDTDGWNVMLYSVNLFAWFFLVMNGE